VVTRRNVVPEPPIRLFLQLMRDVAGGPP